MKRSASSLFFTALILAWLIVLVILFIVVSHWDFVHIYFLPLQVTLAKLMEHVALAKFLVDVFASVLAIAVFSAACMGLGFAVLRNWQEQRANRLAAGTIAFVVGEIIFSIIFLTIIVLYRLTPGIVAVSIALGLFFGGRRLVAFLRGCLPMHMPDDYGRGERILFGLVAASFAATALYSSAILGYDSVVQYFSQSKLMALEQAAVYTFHQDPFIVSAFHPGILYTAVIELFGDQAARMLSWINGLAILLLGLAIGEKIGTRPKGHLWFLVTMLTSTAFVDLLGDGKVELISTAPLLAAVYLMLCSVKRFSKWTFALIGLLLGFAMIARPYNVFLASTFMLTFYIIHTVAERRGGDFRPRQLISSAAWIFPPLVALGAFHVWQNWLWLGDPLAEIVNGTHISSAAWQWQFNPKLLNLYRALYLFVATFSNSPQSLGNVSPFVLGFVPFLFVSRVRKELQSRPVLLRLVLAAAITLTLWLVMFFTVVEIRYVLFLWVIFFLAISEVMVAATEYMRPRVGNIMGLLVGVSLLYVCVRAVVISLDTYSPIDSSGQAHCHDLGFCTFLEPLNTAAQPGERIFVVNAYRYYLRPDLFACSSRADEYAALERLAQMDAPEFWVEAYQQGFKYVSYEANFATFHAHFGTLPPPRGLPGWLSVTEVISTPDHQQTIYRLDATAWSSERQSYCMLDSSGIWQILHRNSPPPE